MNAWTIASLALAYRTGETTPVEVVEHYLERIAREDERLRAFMHVAADEARAAARRAERRLADDPEGRFPLLGVPIAHKDILQTEDAPTGGHSRRLAGRPNGDDATAVAKLRAAGAINLGKTNLSEFACGSMDLRGMPVNPWHPDRYTGGSSGGSAAAVAAGLCTAATGTDTAGSIRVPASFCGLVGLKPTYGRVSTAGVVPLSWTTDHVGPLTTTVADAALLLATMEGADPRDPRSRPAPTPLDLNRCSDGVAGLRIGVPQQHFSTDVAPAVEAAVQRSLRLLADAGAELVSVDLPLAGDLAAAGSVLMMSEAFRIHAPSLARHAAAYGRRTRQRILAGGAYSVADVDAAQRIIHAWREQLAGAFARVDAICTPTLPMTAFSHRRQIDAPPDTSWATRHFSVAGNPAITIPCGRDSEGLPIGLQIAARHYDEATLFRIATALENAQPWPLVAGVGGNGR
jgi:aspartyl-tRNA(Asn)/glutamyl-tRNA(Gln) amidotransferase subunit A